MARLSAPFLVFLLAAASALALASCGGEDADLLPGTTADQIESNLEEVERLADERDCIGAESAVAEVTASVEELRGVDRRLKAALEEGTERLSVVVGRCEEEETVEEETEPSLETDVEGEEVEDEEKPEKEKPDKDEEKSSEQEEPSEDEGPELPPQANGKGEEKGGGPETPSTAEPPAEATPPPSGGVGPSVGVE
jgi:hypothetical protein